MDIQASFGEKIDKHASFLSPKKQKNLLQAYIKLNKNVAKILAENPEGHLLEKNKIIIPPGGFENFWLIINTKNHKEIDYLKSIYLAYKTKKNVKEKIKLQFRQKYLYGIDQLNPSFNGNVDGKWQNDLLFSDIIKPKIIGMPKTAELYEESCHDGREMQECFNLAVLELQNNNDFFRFVHLLIMACNGGFEAACNLLDK